MIKTFCIFVLLCLLPSPALTQRKSAARFDPDGSFWIVGDPPADFSEFDSINLNAKRARYLEPPGLRTHTTFHRYKTLVVKRDNFSFYFPMTTSIILSLLLTLLFAFFRR